MGEHCSDRTLLFNVTCIRAEPQKPRRWKSMLIHQGWFTALYTQHLLDSQSFEFLICILLPANMPLIRCTNVFYKGDYPVTVSAKLNVAICVNLQPCHIHTFTTLPYKCIYYISICIHLPYCHMHACTILQYAYIYHIAICMHLPSFYIHTLII